VEKCWRASYLVAFWLDNKGIPVNILEVDVHRFTAADAVPHSSPQPGSSDARPRRPCRQIPPCRRRSVRRPRPCGRHRRRVSLGPADHALRLVAQFLVEVRVVVVVVVVVAVVRGADVGGEGGRWEVSGLIQVHLALNDLVELARLEVTMMTVVGEDQQ